MDTLATEATSAASAEATSTASAALAPAGAEAESSGVGVAALVAPESPARSPTSAAVVLLAALSNESSPYCACMRCVCV